MQISASAPRRLHSYRIASHWTPSAISVRPVNRYCWRAQNRCKMHHAGIDAHHNPRPRSRCDREINPSIPTNATACQACRLHALDKRDRVRLHIARSSCNREDRLRPRQALRKRNPPLFRPLSQPTPCRLTPTDETRRYPARLPAALSSTSGTTTCGSRPVPQFPLHPTTPESSPPHGGLRDASPQRHIPVHDTAPPSENLP